MRDAARGRDIEVVDVTDNVMRAISTTTTPQGCVAVVEMPPTDFRVMPPRVRLGLVLAGVSDPGNAGTLIRSAAGAAADCVVLTSASVDPFNPKTVRASAGTIFRTSIVTGVGLADAAAALHERGCTTVGADARAARSCYEADLASDVCFVLGNEAHGLGATDGAVDSVVSLPLPGRIESLNVSVAGAILLFEAVRQRSLAPTGLSSPPDD